MVSQLQKEVKDLKFEIGQKEDALSVKLDTIRDLQDQLDNVKRAYGNDSDRFKREIYELKELLGKKEVAVSQIAKNYDDICESLTVEIPICFRPQSQIDKQFA